GGANDGKPVALLDVAPVDVNVVDGGGEAGLVRAVPAGGDVMVRGDVLIGDETTAIYVGRCRGIAQFLAAFDLHDLAETGPRHRQKQKPSHCSQYILP